MTEEPEKRGRGRPRGHLELYKDGELVPRNDYQIRWKREFQQNMQKLSLRMPRRLAQIIENSDHDMAVVSAIKEVNARA